MLVNPKTLYTNSVIVTDLTIKIAGAAGQGMQTIAFRRERHGKKLKP
jgi:hypothetical protein